MDWIFITPETRVIYYMLIDTGMERIVLIENFENGESEERKRRIHKSLRSLENKENKSSWRVGFNDFEGYQ